MIRAVPALTHSLQTRDVKPASGFEKIHRPSLLTPFGRVKSVDLNLLMSGEET
jgi:hypothetical protein